MQGLWLEDRNLASRRDLPEPSPARGEALIRLDLAGICRTDLELVRGYYPYRGVPGHEFVGTVVHAPGSRALEGRRVAGEINAVCRDCPECRAGRANHCRNRTVLGIAGRDGAFAELLALPVENLHPVPEGVSLRHAVFTEPLAAALRILEQGLAGDRDRLLLVGGGKLGQLVARALAWAVGSLAVVARYAKQRELLGGLGVEVYEELPPGMDRFDVVVEASGSPGGLKLAAERVRPGGTIVLKSTYAGKASLDFSGLVVNEVRLAGSRCGPFPPALEMMGQGRFDPEPLIEAEFSLAEGVEAFERAGRPGAMKVLLRPGRG